MKLKYRLTEKGLEKTRQFINDLIFYREEDLDAKLDTSANTPIPTVEDIESSIEMFEKYDEYLHRWHVTDKISIMLHLEYKKDYLEADIIKHEPKKYKETKLK